MIERLILAAALTLPLAGCVRPRPEPVALGEVACAHCHMTVTDRRFAAQVLTRKGRAVAFDDVECLASALAQGQVKAEDVRSLWVSDFARPDRWLEATDAVYFRLEGLSSPMGTGVVALAVEDSATLRSLGDAPRLGWADLLREAQDGADGNHHAGHGASSGGPAGPGPAAGKASAPSRAGRAALVVSPGGPLPSLAAAIAAARPGDRIVVRPGAYHTADVVVDKPLTIEGEGRPVLDGGGARVLTVRADRVTLRGLVIRNVSPSSLEDRAGIQLERVRDCVVEDNELTDTFFGIYLAGVHGCRVAGNRIRGTGAAEAQNGSAIHLWGDTAVTVERNLISGHRDGVYLEFNRHAEIVGNHAEGNRRYGLHFMFTDSSTYRANTFARNGAGVAVMYSRRVTMEGNRFLQNRGTAAYGLLLKDIADSRIAANTFSENTVALHMEGSDRLEILDNDIVRNGWGVRLMADAQDNLFRGNRFEGNGFDVSTNGRRHTSRFQANYWDRYAGYDLDRDGRGDVPHRPVRLFSIVVERHRPALILLRSHLVELLDAAERVLPVLTPATLEDERPLMRRPG